MGSRGKWPMGAVSVVAGVAAVTALFARGNACLTERRGV